VETNILEGWRIEKILWRMMILQLPKMQMRCEMAYDSKGDSLSFEKLVARCVVKYHA
jgi:hypothetical protein